MFASAKTNQRILEHTQTGIMLLDDDLCVLFMNPAAETLLAMSGQRGVGVKFSDVIQETDSTEKALKRCALSGQAFIQRETEFRLQNGQRLLADYCASPISHPETKKASILIELHGRERLARISREEELLTKQQTSRSLVRGMAHEIKNPLGGIRGAAQLLEGELDNAELREFTSIIIEETDRLRDLVDRMLGPNQLPHRESINIHEVLERILQLIDVDCGGEIKLVRDYDPSIPEFDADKDQLIQACLNICRNAMQAMLEDNNRQYTPHITVKSRTVRQLNIGNKRYKLLAKIDVIDNGPGIPAELQQHLFYPMVSGRAKGTGLGLSIAQTIINQHHGIIEFDSQPQRTVFSIYLPLDHL